MDVYPRFRFHLARCYEEAPALLIAIGLGTLFIVTALASAAVRYEEVHRLSADLGRSGQRSPHRIQAATMSSASVLLPQFSGAALVQGINRVAHEMAIPFDEATYVLDDSNAVPYTRYRVTLKTLAGYAEIRRFIPALSAEFPQVEMDSIHCARPDAAAPALSCELAFTAFYRKAGDA